MFQLKSPNNKCVSEKKLICTSYSLNMPLDNEMHSQRISTVETGESVRFTRYRSAFRPLHVLLIQVNGILVRVSPTK